MLAFKRMYVDIPTATHAKLVKEAATRGMSQKGLLAELIEDCCKPAKRSKKKAKRKPAKRKR